MTVYVGCDRHIKHYGAVLIHWYIVSGRCEGSHFLSKLEKGLVYYIWQAAPHIGTRRSSLVPQSAGRTTIYKEAVLSLQCYRQTCHVQTDKSIVMSRGGRSVLGIGISVFWYYWKWKFATDTELLNDYAKLPKYWYRKLGGGNLWYFGVLSLFAFLKAFLKALKAVLKNLLML